MTARSRRFGFDGTGRSLGAEHAPKVARGEITAQYDVDTITIGKNMGAFDSDQKRTLTKRPGPKGFDLLEGEMAYMVLGGDGTVLTALNGIEAPIVAVYPNNPTLVRDIVESMIQPIGIVREDVNTLLANPKVTLRVGGTCPIGAACVSNVPGQENTTPSVGRAIVFGVPDLLTPIQYGNPASGVPENKVVLQARAASKKSTARRALNIISHAIHDPDRFIMAFKDHPKIGNAWIRTAQRVVNSYKTAFTIGMSYFLERDIVRVSPTATALLGPGGAALSPFDTAARLAEVLGVLDEASVYGAMTKQQRTFWKETQFGLTGRILQVADPSADAYNAKFEFGFVRDVQNNTWTSVARVGQTGEIARTPTGRLLKQSLIHLPHALEAYTEAGWDETRLSMGVSLNTPANASTAVADVFLTPRGGIMADVK